MAVMLRESTVSVDDVKIDTTLMVVDQGVCLVRVPPPMDGLSDTDITRWNFQEVVWTGKLRFIERELIASDNQVIQEKEIIRGIIQLENTNNDVFAYVYHTLDSHNVEATSSRKAYRVLIDYNNKKFALGLVFKDASDAQEFSIALQEVETRARAAIEAQRSFANDLSLEFERMNLGTTTVRETSVRVNGDGEEEDVEEEEDDDFGDFVSG